MNRGGASYYYLTDALGSVVGLADETGAKVNSYGYSPRGVARAANTEQVPQPYRFAGGYQDPTGLYHLGARYYDPSIGRFTQPDPSGQEKKPYLHAEGGPVNCIDQRRLFRLNSVADALRPIGDLATEVAHLAQKDTRALWGDVAGVVDGGATGTLCGAVVAAAAPPTLGTSLGAQTGCYAAAWATGTIASNLVSG